MLYVKSVRKYIIKCHFSINFFSSLLFKHIFRILNAVVELTQRGHNVDITLCGAGSLNDGAYDSWCDGELESPYLCVGTRKEWIQFDPQSSSLSFVLDNDSQQQPNEKNICQTFNRISLFFGAVAASASSWTMASTNLRIVKKRFIAGDFCQCRVPRCVLQRTTSLSSSERLPFRCYRSVLIRFMNVLPH